MMKSVNTTIEEFDWNAYYEKLILSGVSHKEAIRLTQLADISFTQEQTEDEREKERLERARQRLIPLHLKENRNNEH